MSEAVLATVGNNALVLGTTEENSLRKDTSQIERRASAMEVTNDLSYSAAGDLLKRIKTMQKKIKEYWEPLRISTKKAYDDVLAKKKEMMDAVDGAEKILNQRG